MAATLFRKHDIGRMVKKMRQRSVLKRGISSCMVIFLVLMVLMPLIYLVSHSLKGQDFIYSIYSDEKINIWQRVWIKPFYVNLDQYYQVLFRTPKLLYMFWNSVFVVVPIVIGQIVIAFLAAYGFSKLKFPGSETLFFVYIVIMLMPFQVTLVPNYIMLSKLKMLDTKWALILPGVFNTFSVFFLKQYMEGIDKSFLEEARLLGANEIQILKYIILPLCKPILVSVIMFVFIDYWSMVEQPITFIKTETRYPLSVYLGTITDSKKGIGFACSVFYMVLPVGLAIYAQSDLTDGLRITNLK